MPKKPAHPVDGPQLPPPSPPESGGTSATVVGKPNFAEPEPTADPGTFRVWHASDAAAYKQIDALNKERLIQPTAFPAPRGGTEPQLTLAQVLAANDVTKRILAQGQIVFHATGDCGSTRGPATETQVTDKMLSDFQETDPKELPQFNLLLGDVVYSFGEAQYYYDQFYEPYRDYPSPILAVAGNHDGMVAPGTRVDTLAAFLRNFCAAQFEVTPEAGGLSRTAQIQPGVFYTFDAPFVRILAFYSNMLEDPGVLSDANIGRSQLDFLEAALQRVKKERYAGALLFAHHHPPYTASTAGSRHGWSVDMLKQMDQVCSAVGVWPHAVLAGHVHNYQRFTRTRSDGTQVPYLSCGNGGHNVQRLARNGAAPIRTPQIIQPKSASADQVVFENYDDLNYGYLRVIVTATQLRLEYHAASDGPGVKTPDDQVSIDLASRQIAHFEATDLGRSAQRTAVRQAVRGRATVRRKATLDG